MLILLSISAAIQVILLPVLLSIRGKAVDFVDGDISEDTFTEALATQQGVQFLQGAIQAAILVLTMIWMFRLAQNHRAFGRPGSTWSPGWAIGGWFVPPGAVYVVPWLMFRELWKGSDPENRPNDPQWDMRKCSPLVGIWWVLYGLIPIIGVVVGVIIAFSNFDGENQRKFAERLDSFFVIQFVLGIVAIGTTAVFAKLVHELTRRQQFLTGEA